MRRFIQTILGFALASALTAVLSSAGFAAAASTAVTPEVDSPVTIARVFTSWRDAASFKRISEYFTGHENTGGITVLRTHPEQRTGFYFLVRAANHGGPQVVKINLDVITPADHKAKAYVFSTTLPAGDSILNVGLTAEDWPDDKANPIAWKLELVNAAGQILAGEKSYLWEKPLAN